MREDENQSPEKTIEEKSQTMEIRQRNRSRQRWI
jgi:hypothetical protein